MRRANEGRHCPTAGGFQPSELLAHRYERRAGRCPSSGGEGPGTGKQGRNACRIWTAKFEPRRARLGSLRRCKNSAARNLLRRCCPGVSFEVALVAFNLFSFLAAVLLQRCPRRSNNARSREPSTCLRHGGQGLLAWSRIASVACSIVTLLALVAAQGRSGTRKFCLSEKALGPKCSWRSYLPGSWGLVRSILTRGAV